VRGQKLEKRIEERTKEESEKVRRREVWRVKDQRSEVGSQRSEAGRRTMDEGRG
jgi:hypothetical protein